MSTGRRPRRKKSPRMNLLKKSKLMKSLQKRSQPMRKHQLGRRNRLLRFVRNAIADYISCMCSSRTSQRTKSP